ncbi:MAG: hypothetical protein N3E51_02835 [Candidatus Micrarchaeota archaeon]|nr:hypothetical protein [Candidatus Micrarchaeota archaeon]
MAGRRTLGQGSTEYILLVSFLLIVALLGVVFISALPSFAADVAARRSEDYWKYARPVAITSVAMYPNRLVLEIKSHSPTTITLRQLYVDGIPLMVYNHSIPFRLSSFTPQCSSSENCQMRLMPGELRIVSTENFTSNNPCVSGQQYLISKRFFVNLTITYNSSDGVLKNQTGKEKISGLCTLG